MHGGPDKAVYAYALESIHWWESELGRELAPGSFGENLTTEGVDVDGALVGELWRVGTALLAVRQPRMPCYKLGIRMGDDGFPDRFVRAARPGAYLGVIEDGTVRAGDPIVVEHRPEASMSVAQLAEIRQLEPGRARELLGMAGIPESWQTWAQRRIGLSGESPEA